VIVSRWDPDSEEPIDRRGGDRFDTDGGVTWRGAIYYQSQSPAFARLNGIACVYEYHVDASGKTEATQSEWT
jgi:hypothetical protein